MLSLFLLSDFSPLTMLSLFPSVTQHRDTTWRQLQISHRHPLHHPLHYPNKDKDKSLSSFLSFPCPFLIHPHPSLSIIIHIQSLIHHLCSFSSTLTSSSFPIPILAQDAKCQLGSQVIDRHRQRTV